MGKGWKELPILTEPKKIPPSQSWWATADAQATREGFMTWAHAEQSRIVGNVRFGGGKRIHDKFPTPQKKKQR